MNRRFDGDNSVKIFATSLVASDLECVFAGNRGHGMDTYIVFDRMRKRCLEMKRSFLAYKMMFVHQRVYVTVMVFYTMTKGLGTVFGAQSLMEDSPQGGVEAFLVENEDWSRFARLLFIYLSQRKFVIGFRFPNNIYFLAVNGDLVFILNGTGFKADPKWFFIWSYGGLRYNQGPVSGSCGPYSDGRNDGVRVYIGV